MTSCLMCIGEIGTSGDISSAVGETFMVPVADWVIIVAVAELTGP